MCDRMEEEEVIAVSSDVPRHSDKIAVELHHVYRSYGQRRNKLHVLRDLSMAVPTGFM